MSLETMAAHDSAMSVVSPNQPRMQLRRAVYVHVSDLTSAYNIDHARLETELARVKEEIENPPQAEKPRSNSFGGVPIELDTSTKKRLQAPKGGSNMVLLVGKVRIVVDKNRVDGSRVRLAEVAVGDETGTVSLRARDAQIDVLTEISNRSGAVVLRNCILELYQGKHIRLTVTKWGKLTSYPDQVPSTPPPPSKINYDRNFSLINLSLVASETVHPTSGSQSPWADPYQGHDTDSQAMKSTMSGQSGRSFMSAPSSAGARRPRSGRNKPSSAPGMPMHYSDSLRQQYAPTGPMTHGYPVGMPGYFPPPSRQQQDSMQNAQQQQLMMQHQYEMQQRQMHMYHSQTDSQQRRSMQPDSPMMIPGVPSGSFSPPEMSMSPPQIRGSNQYLMAVHGNHPPPPPQQPGPRPQSPGTAGRMNPQAATFDPNTHPYHRHPSS